MLRCGSLYLLWRSDLLEINDWTSLDRVLKEASAMPKMHAGLLIWWNKWARSQKNMPKEPNPHGKMPILLVRYISRWFIVGVACLEMHENNKTFPKSDLDVRKRVGRLIKMILILYLEVKTIKILKKKSI